MTPTLTPKQVATALNVTNREAWRVMRSAGAAEVYRNGRLTLVLTEESLERWLSDPNYRRATTGEGKRSGAAPIRSRKKRPVLAAKKPQIDAPRLAKTTPDTGSTATRSATVASPAAWSIALAYASVLGRRAA